MSEKRQTTSATMRYTILCSTADIACRQAESSALPQANRAMHPGKCL
jgi:hypothetical protein